PRPEREPPRRPHQRLLLISRFPLTEYSTVAQSGQVVTGPSLLDGPTSGEDGSRWLGPNPCRVALTERPAFRSGAVLHSDPGDRPRALPLGSVLRDCGASPCTTTGPEC